MASTLVIEDGTIVPNATSYVTVTEAREYSAARGITLSAVDATVDVMAIKAMDYLESLREQFQGTKVDDEQELQFPRDNVYIDEVLLANDSIPKLLKKAQCQLIIEINSGVLLMPTRKSAEVKIETVGPISTEYFQGSPVAPEMTTVNSLLNPLFKTTSVGMLPVVRA
jgi:hypothetical protein